MKFYLNVNGGKPIVYAFYKGKFVGVNINKDGYEFTEEKYDKVEYNFICTFKDVLASLGISKEGEYKFPLAKAKKDNDEENEKSKSLPKKAKVTDEE